MKCTWLTAERLHSLPSPRQYGGRESRSVAHHKVRGGFAVHGDTAIHFPKHQGIKCDATLAGECWLVVEGIPEPVLLNAGDCFLLPRGLCLRFPRMEWPDLGLVTVSHLSSVTYIQILPWHG
jgi:hypothetical protein